MSLNYIVLVIYNLQCIGSAKLSLTYWHLVLDGPLQQYNLAFCHSEAQHSLPLYKHFYRQLYMVELNLIAYYRKCKKKRKSVQ